MENINLVYERNYHYWWEQLVDHHTAVHHNQPNCESYQELQRCFKDKAHGVLMEKFL